MTLPGFDIFCRVVDNYGDIGVCWRLARQLARHPQAGQVRLWVDDLASFARIEPQVDVHAARQQAEGVTLLHWSDPAPLETPLDVVIEAFACDPPPSFVAGMHGSLWINLEYLSAEDWVEDFHGLPSLQANGLNKNVFFPGFTESTGGLLREPDLLSSQAQWHSRPELRWQMLQDMGMPGKLIELLRAGGRQAFVFCYGNAPAKALAQAFQHTDKPTVAIVPQNVLPALASWQSDTFKVFECPFVDQRGFDQLLWSSDLNFVRGEDSVLRAIWAGKPFLWHIYQQADNAHLNKLDAWLARTEHADAVRQLMLAWNQGDDAGFLAQLQHALQPDPWQRWSRESAALRSTLAEQTSLVERLLAFCAEKRGSG